MTRSSKPIGPRAGHYVDGRHYLLTLSNQAKARASFLASEYGRTFQVLSRYETLGPVSVSFTAGNEASVAGALLNCIGA